MPITLQEFKGKGTMLALWSIEEPEEHLLLTYSRLATNPQALPDYKAVSRRREWLAARLALLNLLGTETKMMPLAQKGRPLLAAPSGELAIAHSHTLAAVVYHPQGRVAVDVENLAREVRPATPALAMNATELEWIRRYGHAAFLQLWTAKETAYKLLHDQHPEETLSFKQHLRVVPEDWCWKAPIGQMTVEVDAPWLRASVICDWFVHANHIVTYALLDFPVQNRKTH